MRCGEQIEELGRQHLSNDLSKQALKAKVIEALTHVQLPILNVFIVPIHIN